MPKKFYKAEEIINILRQVEVLVSHITPMSFGKDKPQIPAYREQTGKVFSPDCSLES